MMLPGRSQKRRRKKKTSSSLIDVDMSFSVQTDEEDTTERKI